MLMVLNIPTNLLQEFAHLQTLFSSLHEFI
jgi:hypothetical protein